eukprot:1077331-Pleurochrysis_carterae.AAC.2
MSGSFSQINKFLLSAQYYELHKRLPGRDAPPRAIGSRFLLRSSRENLLAFPPSAPFSRSFFPLDASKRFFHPFHCLASVCEASPRAAASSAGLVAACRAAKSAFSCSGATARLCAHAQAEKDSRCEERDRCKWQMG